MRQIWPEKIPIQPEKGWLRKAVQHWDQVLVIGAPNGDIHPDDPEADSPLTQQLPLPGGQIFVEH